MRQPVCWPHNDGSLGPESGGWGGAELPESYTDRCDFERVDASISSDEFEERFVRLERPAIIENAAGAMSHWTRRFVESEYQERAFSVSRREAPSYDESP